MAVKIKNLDKIDMNEEFHDTVPNEFDAWVRNSFGLLGSLGKQMENGEAVAFLVSHGIPESEAIEIILFVPIAFCRQLLPQVNWPAEYTEFKNSKQVEKRFSENLRYTIIQGEVNAYWANAPTKEVILNIAGRSAEFQAINNLLLKGGSLEDVAVSKTVVNR
jgi:hypothetical protein